MQELVQWVTDSWSLVSTIVWGCMLFVFVLGPLLVRTLFKFYVPTEILFFDPDEVSLPNEVRKHMSYLRVELESTGFRLASCFALPKLVGNAKSISMLFVNEEKHDAALVSALWASAESNELKIKYVEFIRRFEGTSVVQVSNSKNVGAFRSPKDDFTFQFPAVQDVHQLYDIHQKLASAYGIGKARISLLDDFGGNVEAYIQERVIAEPARYQERLGFFRKIPEGYGLTLMGAYVFAWGEMFPFKHCIQWRVASRSKAALRGLETTKQAREG